MTKARKTDPDDKMSDKTCHIEDQNDARKQDLVNIRHHGHEGPPPTPPWGSTTIIHLNSHISRRMKAISLPSLSLPARPSRPGQEQARQTMHRVKYCGRKVEAESNMILPPLLAQIARGGLPACFLAVPSRSFVVRRPPGRIFSPTQLCNQQTAFYVKSARVVSDRVGEHFYLDFFIGDTSSSSFYRHGDHRETTLSSLSGNYGSNSANLSKMDRWDGRRPRPQGGREGTREEES